MCATLGATPTKNSGASNQNGDAILFEAFAIECKSYKSQKSIVFTRDIQMKHKTEVLSLGYTPVWVMESSEIGPMILMSLADFRDFIDNTRYGK